MKKVLAWALLLLLTVPAFAKGGKDDGWPVSSAYQHRSYFGYRFYVEGAYGMGMSFDTHPFSVKFNAPLRYFNAGTTHGMQLGRIVFLGGGVLYTQVVGEAVDPEQPIRSITPYGDIRLNFGDVFSTYLDLRPGVAYLWESKSWSFSTSLGVGIDIARSFQLGFEFNLLPLNIGTEHASQLDALIGIHAGLSFGRGCRR